MSGRRWISFSGARDVWQGERSRRQKGWSDCPASRPPSLPRAPVKRRAVARAGGGGIRSRVVLPPPASARPTHTQIYFRTLHPCLTFNQAARADFDTCAFFVCITKGIDTFACAMLRLTQDAHVVANFFIGKVFTVLAKSFI